MKTVEKTNVNIRYDMTTADMDTLRAASKDTFELISNAFIFGYAKGARAATAELKQAPPVSLTP